MYVTYDDSGMITATIIGPGAGYGDLLDAAGKAWLFLEGVTSLDPLAHSVDVANRVVIPQSAAKLIVEPGVRWRGAQMSLPVYLTGVVDVTNGGTTVVGTGCMWSGINAKQGDNFTRDDGTAEITEVTDAATLQITAWPGATVSGGDYAIQQNYVVAESLASPSQAEDVGVMLEKLHTDGLPFIVDPDETVPDPSYGDEGQFAFQPQTGKWWVKQGGVWVPSMGLTALGYGGTSATSLAIGLGTKVFTTQPELAYNGARVRATSAANLANWMEGPASYSGSTLTMTCDVTGGSGTHADWLFAVAGQQGATGATGATGPTGPTGPQGPPGASGAGTGNVNGPASAVADHIATFNGTTGTLIKDGGKLIADLAPIASPAFTGTPTTATTPTAGDNTTKLATTAFVGTAVASLAPLASPTFTGDPKAPTPTAGDNDTSIATTAFVTTALSGVSSAAVRYDIAQALTAPQQAQARQNIYAAPFDALAYNGMQINGGMQVSQEKGTTAITGVLANSVYAVDGWRVSNGGTNVLSAQQVTDAPPGYSNSLKLSVTTASASLAVGDYATLQHQIEGYRASRLAWGTTNAQPLTIGIWVKANRAGTYSGTVINGAANRSYMFSFVITTSLAWQFITTTNPGDTAGAWTSDNTTGLYVIITLAAGTTYISPPGVWTAGFFLGVAGTTNGVAATTDTFQITGLVVLPGIEAPSAARSPFIMRPYDQELLLCMRHWERLMGSYRQTLTSGTFASQSLPYKVLKRVSPSAAFISNGSLASNSTFQAFNTIDTFECAPQFQGTSNVESYNLGFTVTVNARI